MNIKEKLLVLAMVLGLGVCIGILIAGSNAGYTTIDGAPGIGIKFNTMPKTPKDAYAEIDALIAKHYRRMNEIDEGIAKARGMLISIDHMHLK